MNQQRTISKLSKVIKEKYQSDASGHDWHHIERVWKTANIIASKEKNADLYVVELAALCHELGDRKMEPDGIARHGQRTAEVLISLGVNEDSINAVVAIVENASYSKNMVGTKPLSLEGKIVQDADRLEALGAIGISRAFAFAGSRGNPVHDPAIKPLKGKALLQAYAKDKNTAINHFYEKLLLLKDKMNTKTGKRIAARRHKFMEQFLQEFFTEWDLKDII